MTLDLALPARQGLSLLGPCPQIRTRRLTLRPHAMRDARAIAASLADFEVSRMLLRVPQPYSLTDALEWLESETTGNGEAWHAAITLDGDGHIGMASIERQRTGWHLGYWLNRKVWGRGIMSEAAFALLAAFLRQRADEPVLSSVFADNTASLKVQMKLGFTITGIADVFVPARGASVNAIKTLLTPAALHAGG